MAPGFVRANVAGMQGYTPGEQPGEGERVVKLNTNENPYPPSPKVLAALREIDAEHLRRYPNPNADRFRDAAARKWGLSREHFICGNGSDDLLTIATRTFVPPGGTLAFPEPTYSLYPTLARLEDANCAGVPWGSDHSLPIEALLETKANAIYLANPNAPTGTAVPKAAVVNLAGKFPGLVLVDEAYADFADENCMALAAGMPNVIVMRSMSKAYSLAGLRFGYAAGSPAVIAEMMKVKDSYNCDAIAIIAATAALEDHEYARGIWELVRQERARLAGELTRLGFTPLPSQANFLLVGCPGGQGKAAYTKLKQQGILVRFFDKPGLSDKIRITVGTSTENNALLAGLQSLNLTEKAA
jgi:histidinol-phosphate aminotransferase